MTKAALARELLARLPPPKKGRLIIWDTKVRGLAYRLTANGSGAFYVVRRQGGKVLWVRLGAFPEMSPEAARRKADGEVVPVIVDGGNPNATKRELREAATVKEGWEEFERRSEPHLRPASLKAYRSVWTLHVSPEFGGTRMQDVTKDDVAAWHRRVGSKAGKYTANRACGLLRSIYRGSGYPGPNPAAGGKAGVKHYHEDPRERVLSEDEVRAVLLSVEQESATIRDCLRLMFATGARIGNVQAARWDQLNLAAATWTIPAASAKGKRTIGVPLVPAAVVLLKARQSTAARGCPWVFPSERGKQAGEKPLREMHPAWRRIVKRATLLRLAEALAAKRGEDADEARANALARVGAIRERALGRKESVDAAPLDLALAEYQAKAEKAKADVDGAMIRDVRLHDVRRTVGSFLAMNGTPILAIARLLGHAGTKTTERAYAFLGIDSLREPLAKVTAALNPKPVQEDEE